MKKLFLIFFFFSFTLLQAQNLVPNPSFEDYTDTVIAGDTFCNCTQWYTPTNGTPDYFNSHNYGQIGGVPSNYMGYQYPHTGNAYWGFQVIVIDPSWPATKNAREYIQTKLLDSLHKGIKYCVSFYVSLADSANYATDGIAAYFSDNAVSHFGTLFQYLDTLNYNPQVFNPHGNIITDTKNWTLISGSFIANGGEQYITIGNFWDDANTDTMWVGGGYLSSAPSSYLYIDDVSVSADTSTCLSTVINEISNKDLISIFPNPASSEIKVIGNQYSVNGIDIYNMLGERVYQSLVNSHSSSGIQPMTNAPMTNTPITINVSALPIGMYFMEIRTENGVEVKKFVKQ